MNIIKRLISYFRSPRRDADKHGYIVIPRAIVDELPRHARMRAKSMLSDLTVRARLKYPDQWYQVILRESNGKFKKHPSHGDADDKLF